jgi:tripartite-type tricarboxylate transporter receptor subunit TctC
MKQVNGNWRGLFLGMVIVFIALTAAPGLTAEKFPDKQITVICPWPPGGRSDMSTRIIAAVLEKNLGQPVVVMNKPGAGGYIGLKSAATAKPDGYTLGIAGASFLLYQYTGESKIRLEEFKWIGQSYYAAFTVSVHAESPWKTLEEFLDYAKKHPGQLKHGTSGYGVVAHVLSEGFAKAAGIKLHQIHYKGDAPSVMALASKELDVNTAPLGSLRSLIEAGKVRVLALQADKRSPQYPNIPTLKERGIDWSTGSFEGFVAPKDTPDDIMAILDKAMQKSIADPSINEKFMKMDFLVEPRNQKEWTTYIQKQDKILQGLLKEMGIIK